MGVLPYFGHHFRLLRPWISPRYFSYALPKSVLLGVLLQKFVVVIWSAGAGPKPAFIQFVSLTNQSADFLIYLGETTPGTGLPYWDKFVYTLLKSGNELVPQAVYICGSKARL